MPDTDPSATETRTRNSVRPFLVATKNLQSPECLSFRRPKSALEDVYSFCLRGDIDAAVKAVLRIVDGLLRAGNFEECDRLFQSAELDRLDPEAATSLLAYSNLARDHLPNRRQFARSVRAWLQAKDDVEAEVIHDLLDGLE